MKAEFPMFELYGPPCQNDNCNGVLTPFISMKTNECWKQCSICHQKFEIKKQAPCWPNLLILLIRSFQELTNEFLSDWTKSNINKSSI